MAEIKLNKPKKQSSKKLPYLVVFGGIGILLSIIVIIGGTIAFNNYQQKVAMEESFKTLTESLNVNLTQDKTLLRVEAAPELTYSSTTKKELEKVPDQLRNLFVSYTGDSDISVSSLDISTVGEKQVTVTITKQDRFGQIAQKQERFVVTVVDTNEPQVDVIGSVIMATSEKEAEANILRVADPVFGYYKYSSTLENHTYKIDFSDVRFDVPGNKYTAKVIINDSGNIVERLFDVYVPKLDVNGNPIEDIVIEPQEIVEDKNEEDIVDEQTEQSSTEEDKSN